jgi:hypothetical protein
MLVRFDYSGLMLVRWDIGFGANVCSGCVFENERACPVHVGNFNCSDNNGIYVKKDGIKISVEQ